MCFDEELLLHIKQKSNFEAAVMLSSADLYNAMDSTGATLLHFSSVYGNADITQFLLDSGANVNAQDELGRTPLLLAVTRKELEISTETIKILLAAKADFLKADMFGEYPLQHVMDNQDFSNISVVKDFFASLREYCVNDANLMADLLIQASCPLERAMYLGNATVTEILISNGIDMDAIHPQNGHTALHVAAKKMDVLNVKMLIKYGADATAKVSDQYLPLSIYLVTANHEPHLRKPEIMKMLMRKYFTAPDKTAETEISFQHILQFGDEEAIRYALEYDVDMSMRSQNENCVLHFLALNRNVNVTRPFNGKISNVNVRNLRMFTPLHYAASIRNISTVKFLLDNGADVNAKNYRENTPLLDVFYNMAGDRYLAEKEVIEVLLYHGADVQILSEDWKTLFDLLIALQRFDVGELLIAQLVLLENLGEPIIDIIRSQIDANQKVKDCYDLCQQQLVDMKKIVVYESITLFKLLSQNEEEIIKRHAYNDELIEEFENFEVKYCVNSNYYYDVLRTRINRVLPKIKLISDATKIVFDPIVPQLNGNYLVVRKIIDYLSYDDMKVLNKR